MAQIKSEVAYKAALKRIDELLPLVNDLTPQDDPNYLELDMISDMVEEYENIHYQIESPSLADVIKLRMYEQGLTMEGLAVMLDLPLANVEGKLISIVSKASPYRVNRSFLHPVKQGETIARNSN